MTILEIAAVVITLAAAGWAVFARKNRAGDGIVVGAVVLVFLLHGIIDHFRIQMVPAYAAAIIVTIVLLVRLARSSDGARIPAKRPVWTRILLAVVSLALLSASVYASTLLPIFTMPKPTGQYAIGTVSKHLIDESRDEVLSADPADKRELMINVWYPVDADEAKGKPVEHYPSELGEAISLVFGFPKQLFSHVTNIPTHVVTEAAMSAKEDKYPVVFFSPGVRSTRFQSITAIEELVSHGYVVVGMEHPYTSAKVAFPDGRDIYYVPEPEFDTSAELYQNNVKGVSIRAADASFVLDKMIEWNGADPDGLLQGRLDLDHVGIFGHSYGGATTAETLAQDKRFKAGVSLEGGFWGDVAHNGLEQPFMYMMTGGTAKSFDPDNPVKDKVFYEEFQPDLQSVMTKSKSDTYYLIVDHFVHQSFTEIALLSPALFAKEIDPVHNIDITRSYVRAFFEQYLKGKPQELLEGPSTAYPEVKFDPQYTQKRMQGEPGQP